MPTEPKLIPTAPQIFFSKHDPDDPRIGELVKPVNFESSNFAENDFVVLGYPDDEGIRLSGGRIGASEAPKIIRQFLYKMTPSLHSNKSVKLADIGDLNLKGSVAERHDEALAITTNLHQKKCRVLSFGGGHDYGYSDVAGFLKAYIPLGAKPLVINFDAHLDVRPTTHGLSSGTPFFRVLNEFQNKFHFVEVGMQPQCNSRAHWNWAKERGAQLFDLRTIEKYGLNHLFNEPVLKDLTASTPVFVSFDIDALTATEAGGCSQAWATGLKTQACLDFLSELYSRSTVRGFGIYEVSPPLDRDFQTSKTAALLAHHFLFES